MNRSLLTDSVIGVRMNTSSQRRGHSLNDGGAPPLLSSSNLLHPNHHLDLFSTRATRTLSIPSPDDSQVLIKLGRFSLGSTNKPLKNEGLDDLLSSTDGGGKHDYDWLLTPPGTPLFSAPDGNDSQTVPRSSSLPRSTSTTKASRLSVSQSSETNNRPRPARSSSVTRPSISTSQHSSYSNKSISILNTSSASVSSYIKSSTPTSRSSSTERPLAPSSRPTLYRSSTPSKGRPMPSATSADKVRPSQNSKPSTPTSRPQISTSLNSPATRSTSRSSTPTRRNPAPSLSTASVPSISVGSSLPNGRAVSSASLPSSPSPRVRSIQSPIVPPDFPFETPPNLRTTLPDRPLSAGRSRPGVPVSLKGNTENPSATGSQKRQSSPIVTRGRLPDPHARSRTPVNGQLTHNPGSHRARSGSELSMRKPGKTSTESTGFGRTISKKSLDMAIRHMDIRNGSNGSIRALSGSTLFPQSIRSVNAQNQQHKSAEVSCCNGDNPIYHHNSEQGNGGGNEESSEQPQQYSAKLTVIDSYFESSRYDTLLLKEDLKSTNWLHRLDDRSDEETTFDNGFEALPEPFDPL